jgi:hypothetical protein
MHLRLLLLFVAAAVMTAIAYAGSPGRAVPYAEMGVFSHHWRGTLVDANCNGRHSPGVIMVCPVKDGTSEFGLVFPDKRFVKFDDTGNAKAACEVRKNPKLTAGGERPLVRVEGTLVGDTLQVQTFK